MAVTNTMLGIVLGCIAAVALLLGGALWIVHRKKLNARGQGLGGGQGLLRAGRGGGES